jgi:hypothetical protein
MCIAPCGSLSALVTVIFIGSLILCGSVGICGSLTGNATVFDRGSLCISDTVEDHDSLGFVGAAVWLGSLMRYVAVVQRGSISLVVAV